jgi:hypothetical protein
MVVVALLGTLLLLVPANLGGFGARSRLESGANTIVSMLGNARGKSIQDGFEVRVEFGTWSDDDGRHDGHRVWFTNVPPTKSGEASAEEGDIDTRRRELATERGKERQWLHTTWMPLPSGLRFTGYSEEAKRWQKVPESEPYQVSFFPDGNVQRPSRSGSRAWTST